MSRARSARPPEGVDLRPSGASIAGRSVEQLPTDAQSPAELARSRRMLAQAKNALHLHEPSPHCLLTRSLGSPFCLPPKGFARVLDAVLMAVVLDLQDPAIPRLLFGRIVRPLPQLVLDVGGRGDPRGDDRHLAPLRENLLGDRQLPARGLPRDGHLRQLGFVLCGLPARSRLQGVDVRELIALLAARQRLRHLALGLEAIDVLADAVNPLLQHAALPLPALLVAGSGPQLIAAGDQLLGWQAGELRAQRLVVRGELRAVALGGFADVRDALAQVGRGGRDLLSVDLNLRGRVDEGLLATGWGQNWPLMTLYDPVIPT